MGSVIQWGGFDSARVLTLPYFHIARCVVYSMQACKDGTLGSPQLVVRSLTTDSHSLGRHTGDGLAATLENILLGGSSKTRSPRLKNTHSPNLGARA